VDVVPSASADALLFFPWSSGLFLTENYTCLNSGVGARRVAALVICIPAARFVIPLNLPPFFRRDSGRSLMTMILSVCPLKISAERCSSWPCLFIYLAEMLCWLFSIPPPPSSFLWSFPAHFAKSDVVFSGETWFVTRSNSCLERRFLRLVWLSLFSRCQSPRPLQSRSVFPHPAFLSYLSLGSVFFARGV